MFIPFAGDARTVRRPDYVPKARNALYPIEKIEPGREHTFTILSNVLTDVLIHPVDGRSQPCTGDRDTCWLSHAEFGTRWQGWLFVRHLHGSRWVRMVCLTAFAVECEPMLLDPELVLRGRIITLRRADKRIRSRMHSKIDRDSSDHVDIPPCPDMLQQLGALWSAPARKAHPKDCPDAIREIRSRYAGSGMPS